MKTLILYGSQYGTTKRYADELSRLTGLPAVSYEKAVDLAGCEQIVYLGGLYAGGVKGLKQAVKKFPAGVRLILVTVGLADVQDEQNIENIRRSVRRPPAKYGPLSPAGRHRLRQTEPDSQDHDDPSL